MPSGSKDSLKLHLKQLLIVKYCTQIEDCKTNEQSDKQMKDK